MIANELIRLLRTIDPDSETIILGDNLHYWNPDTGDWRMLWDGEPSGA